MRILPQSRDIIKNDDQLAGHARATMGRNGSGNIFANKNAGNEEANLGKNRAMEAVGNVPLLRRRCLKRRG
jgi:hypothetical protein